MRVLGIDPGVTGAWAVIDYSAASAANNGSGIVRPKLVEIGDLPTKAVKMSKRTAHRLDVDGIEELFDRLFAPDGVKGNDGYPDTIDRVVVERLSGGPGINSSTAFSLGWTGAVLDSALTRRGVNYISVSPSAWKRALLVPAEKAMAKKRATKLFGSDKGWPQEKDHNRAEAALLALYGAAVRK